MDVPPSLGFATDTPFAELILYSSFITADEIKIVCNMLILLSQ